MIDLKQVPDTNIIIVTAKGTITGDDYENCIIPAIEATLKEYDKLRFLNVMGEEYGGTVFQRYGLARSEDYAGFAENAILGLRFRQTNLVRTTRNGMKVHN